jgi:hypothetical protein
MKEAEWLFQEKFGVWKETTFNLPVIKLATNRCGVKNKREIYPPL